MPKTVKVRVCVAVDADGNHAAAAVWPGRSEEEAKQEATELVEGDWPVAVYWLTAELAVPEEVEVEAEVEQ